MQTLVQFMTSVSVIKTSTPDSFEHTYLLKRNIKKKGLHQLLVQAPACRFTKG